MDFGAVVEAGVPVAAALRSDIQEVPEGREQGDDTTCISASGRNLNP